MTFSKGDTVRLIDAPEDRDNGVIGTVLRFKTNQDGTENYIDVEVTDAPSRSYYGIGGLVLGSFTSRWEKFEPEPEEIRYADVQRGDRIKVIHRNITHGTERVTTATVDSFGYGFAQDAGCKQLAYGNLNNTGWNTQQIFLIERPKFDAVSKVVGAVVRIDQLGTGVKIMNDTWVFVYGAETEYLTDEGFATRNDFGKYTVISEKPF